MNQQKGGIELNEIIIGLILAGKTEPEQDFPRRTWAWKKPNPKDYFQLPESIAEAANWPDLSTTLQSKGTEPEAHEEFVTAMVEFWQDRDRFNANEKQARKGRWLVHCATGILDGIQQQKAVS